VRNFLVIVSLRTMVVLWSWKANGSCDSTLFAIYFLYGPEVLHSAPSQSFMRTSIRCMSAACG
jgi:hypothetical protein